MKDYLVIDVETANREMHISAFSAILVKNNKIAQHIYSLINPNSYFDKVNMDITKITPSMVADSPKFDEFFATVEPLIKGNIVVMQGDNHFDLIAISKECIRYGLEIPTFRFVDTCALAKKYLILESYSLNALADFVGFSFNHHDAAEDTMATYKILEYFNSLYGVDECEEYHYQNTNVKKLNWDCKQKNLINDLIGIILGINFDGIVNLKEIEEINNWINKAKAYKNYICFDEIIDTLSEIIEDGEISFAERLSLLDLAEQLEKVRNTKDKYRKSKVHILQGILKGIVADKSINVAELQNLSNWLNYSKDDLDCSIYKRIIDTIEKTLADGIITKDEEIELNNVISEILNPIVFDSVDSIQEFEGKTFHLTQEFEHFIPRSALEKELIKYGAIKGGVNKKLDYLIVGSMCNDHNSFGTYGSNVLKVIENKKKGANTKIIKECDLPKELFD